MGDELLHRQRFAGHRGLADKQILGSQQAQIGRNHVAGRQLDDIARNQFLDRQFDAARALRVQGDVEVAQSFFCNVFGQVMPQYGGGIADHCLELVGSGVGARFLDEAHQCRQHHHRADDDGGFHVFGEEGHGGQHGQQQIERILIALPQMYPF